MTRVLWFSLFASVLLVNIGCRNTCNHRPLFGRNEPPPPPPKYVPLPGPPQPYMPPIQQSGAVVPSDGRFILPPEPAPERVPLITKSPERVDPQWKPAETPEPRRDLPPSIKLYAPESIDKETPSPEKKPAAQRSFPAIAQFAEAKDNVYAGLRPSLDGLDWLQKNGVQTVVQVRLFGEDDSADRKQIEKRGLRYVAFEISPEALTKERADDFVKLIRDGAKNGIFVYDEDGSLAGGMWYLYMRQGEILDDEPSQIRARGLGLQANREGRHREMWLAVKKFLDENKP